MVSRMVIGLFQSFSALLDEGINAYNDTKRILILKLTENIAKSAPGSVPLGMYLSISKISSIASRDSKKSDRLFLIY
jgi:hypothetical protein